MNDRIQIIRESRGLTQSALAKHAGLQPSAIGHFEAGRRRPSWNNLLKLSEALEVSVGQLMGQTITTGKTADLQNKLGELTFEELAFVDDVVSAMLRRKAN